MILSEAPENKTICGIAQTKEGYTQVVIGVTERRGEEIVLIADNIVYDNQDMKIEI